MLKSVTKPGAPRLLMGVSMAGLALLAACGGGDSVDPPAPEATASSLSGSVAVGAPMADARIRILDSTGAEVAADVGVDASGAFSDVPLTGTGPYRIEACGHAGDNYRCVYSVAQGAGVANVTPLTTAAVLLATGVSPELLMSGNGGSLDAASLASAQTQLRQGLASVLADAGVPSDFDFISGALVAGTRTGYDRVLDAVGVTTGEADEPFVQITPRLGTGNLYLEAGAATQGTLTVDSNAGSVSLAGIETLFQNMSQSMQSEGSCRANLPGLLATSASMSFGGPMPAQGPDDVAETMCDFIGNTDDEGPGWGVSFVSPTLGRCDLSPADPVCRVSFVLKLADGSLESIGEEMAVVRESGTWKFKGEINPIAIRANATVQRSQTIDSSGAVTHTQYSRAFQFDVQAYAGLECAKVAQRNASGSEVVLAYFKPYGSGSPERLSAWRTAFYEVATNPTDSAGVIHGADDTWIQLPEGSAGDAFIRNFYVGGRTITVSLYGDASCATPLAVGGKTEFDVDMMGVPPLSDRMQTFSWPTLTASGIDQLRSLSLANNASTTFQASWTFARGHTGFGQASVCSDGNCGQGSPARLGEANFPSAAQSVSVALTNPGTALEPGDFKMLALYGRTGEGMAVQASFIYCADGGDQAGQCH